MIEGCGVDIIKIDRVRSTMDRKSFLEKIFTPYEREYIRSKGNAAQTAAGLFCAKEAVLKSLGKGIGSIDWHDIEITHEKSGAPRVHVEGWDCAFHISISHDEDTAIACVVAEKPTNEVR